MVAAIKEGNEGLADELTTALVKKGAPHASLYRALFRIEFRYGAKSARGDLAAYEAEAFAGEFGP